MLTSFDMLSALTYIVSLQALPVLFLLFCTTYLSSTLHTHIHELCAPKLHGFPWSLFLLFIVRSVYKLLPVFPLLFLLYCIVFTVAIDLIVHHISEIVQTNAGNTTNGMQKIHITPGFEHQTRDKGSIRFAQ